MLTELHARGLGVIDDTSVLFGPGLNVLTGETGTGKSLLVGAIRLVLGQRAHADLLAGGATEASVDACFDCTPAAAALLSEAGIAVEDEVVISRVIRKGGSRAHVNGRPVTVGMLSQMAAALVEVIGQHSAQNLTEASSQRKALDRYGGADLGGIAKEVREAYESWATLRAEQATLTGDPGALAREQAALSAHLEEIEAVDPAVDEDLHLADRLRLSAQASAAAEAAQAVDSSIDTMREQIAHATTAMRGVDAPTVIDAFSELSGALERCAEEARTLRSFDVDPAEIARIHERVAALRALQRKFGPGLDEVFTFRDQSRERLDALASASVRLDEIASLLEDALTRYDHAAEELRNLRSELAPALETGVMRRLAELGMGAHRFVVSTEREPDPSPTGSQRVTFAIASTPKATPAPIAKTASGGELSRLLLAISAELADRDAPPAIVFDEIDAGTGGETALEIGRQLQELSTARQIIVVTHLAQVACWADHHVHVSRAPGEAPRVAEVRGDQRTVELSRMLSGNPESDHARTHAEELLVMARQERATR